MYGTPMPVTFIRFHTLEYNTIRESTELLITNVNIASNCPNSGLGFLCYVAMVANMQTIAKAIRRPIMAHFVRPKCRQSPIRPTVIEIPQRLLLHQTEWIGPLFITSVVSGRQQLLKPIYFEGYGISSKEA